MIHIVARWTTFGTYTQCIAKPQAFDRAGFRNPSAAAGNTAMVVGERLANGLRIPKDAGTSCMLSAVLARISQMQFL